MKQRAVALGIVLLLSAGLALWVWGINDPFVGSYNANNNYLMLAAKNYLRFGFVQLKTLPTYTAGADFPSANEYYLHHPILFFWIATVPFLLFGFSNWVVHAATGLFAVCAMGMVYAIGREIWDKRIAWTAVLLAVWFPMSTFFWKFMFFEQITLFLNLLVVYGYIRYLKKPKRKWLWVVGFAAGVSILSDWYGAYLMFPFAAMLFTRYRQTTIQVLKVYVPVVAGGILVFLALLYQTGYLSALPDAIGARSIQSELFGLSWWWIRLPVVTLIRFIVYFTPLSIAGLFVVFRLGKSDKRGLRQYMLLFFAVLGMLNILFLPTASWGHGYFQYYLIPFFAYSIALAFWKIPTSYLKISAVFAVMIWSLLINYSKVSQVRKQMWKMDVGNFVHTLVAPHEKIGVFNYPGDVLQNYYFIPAIPFLGDDALKWFDGKRFSDIALLVFTCVSDCSTAEYEFVQSAPASVHVSEYPVGPNRSWIFTKDDRNIAIRPDDTDKLAGFASDKPAKLRLGPILDLYRALKRIIGEVQI